jgi:hypothetical protein
MKIILTENQIKQLQLEINRKKTNDKIIEEIKFIKKVLFSYTNTSTQSEKDKLKFVEKYINEINSKLGIHNNLFEVKKNNIYINENTVKSKIKNSFNLIESRINNLGLIKEVGEVVNPIQQVDFGTQTPETVKSDTEIASDNDVAEFWAKCGISEPKAEDSIEFKDKQIGKCFNKIIKDDPSYQNAFQKGWSNLKDSGLLMSGATIAAKYFGFKLKEKKEEKEGTKPAEGNKFLNWIKSFKWSAFFEGLRNVLQSSGGQLIQKFLSSTGIGAIGVTAAWGIVTLYDIWNLIKGTGNWFNLIIDIVSIASGGWIGNKLSTLKNMVANNIDDVVKTISKNKNVRAIIKPVLKQISNLDSWLKSTMEWAKKKLNADWLGEAGSGVSTVTTDLSSKLETEIAKAESEEKTGGEEIPPPPTNTSNEEIPPPPTSNG